MDGIERSLKLFCDNKSAVLYSNNNRSSTKSKFIDIKFLVVKESVKPRENPIFSKKRQNRNLGKNPKFLYISYDETDFTVGIVSRNLANASNSETIRICTFFETPSIECLKTICDVTKVTYNMYSCDISYLSREMIKMEGRNSVKCQKSKA